MPDANTLVQNPVPALPTDIVFANRVMSPGGPAVPVPVTITNLVVAAAGGAAGTLAAYGDQRFPDHGVATTTDATPTPLAGLRSVTGLSGVMRVTGSVSARNTATGDCATWDVSAALKSVAYTTSFLGTPSVSLFAADNLMTACSVQWGAGPAGLVLIVTGLASAPISWTSSLLSVVG